MSDSPEVERAAKVMLKAETTSLGTYFEQKARALSSAGLLRTGADRLNEKAMEACVRYAELQGDRAVWTRGAVGEPIYDIGRAELTRRKPKVRWDVVSGATKMWVHFYGKPTDEVFPLDAEPEARAYVARKNAEEAV